MGHQVFVALVGLALASCVSAVDWCAPQPYPCSAGRVHVGCAPPVVPTDCLSYTKVPLSAAQKAAFLAEHNGVRQRIASGNQPPFLTAANMNQLVWSDTLADLASLNTQSCAMQHDQCRNTETQNGQNLYITMSSAATYNPTPESIANVSVKAWYGEYVDATVANIKTFTQTTKVIGHFTQAVWGQSTQVGCAIATYRRSGWSNVLVACDYAIGNILSQSVYVAGPPASQCPAGRKASAAYPALCA